MKKFSMLGAIFFSLFFVPFSAHAAFTGEWGNTKSTTQGITRIQIQDTINGRMISAWGQCVPSECDWGDVPLHTFAPHVASKKFTSAVAVWTNSFSVKTMILKLTGKKIAATTYTRFTDNSDRSNYVMTEVFRLTRP